MRDEEQRLRVLRATQQLDSPPEPSFDRLTRLASALLDAPTALVSLVDDRRQFFKSAIGLGEPWASARETPLSHSFCQFAVRQRRPLVVNDARDNPLVRDNLAVSELGVLAYAGVPLFVQTEAIGAFCVIDAKPREWSDRQLDLLDDLAQLVVTEIELRMALAAESRQRALLGALLESVGDGVLACGDDGVLLLVNQEARRMFDDTIQVDKPLPKNWAQNHRSIKLDGTPVRPEEGALSRALEGKTTDDLTFTLQHVGQSNATWVEASGRPVRDAAGAVIAAIAVYRDVTEKVRLEASLRRSEQVHRAIVENLPNGTVVMVDRDLRSVASDGPADLLERIGLDRAVLAPAFDGQTMRREIERDGRFIEVSVVPIFERSEVGSIVVLLYDVTERRLEANLLDTTLANIEDGVALLDSTRRVVFANHAYSTMFGLSQERLQGMTREEFFSHLATLVDDPAAFRERLDVLKQSGEYELLRPRRRILRRSETAVVLKTGNASLVTWHDVTSERQLLAERERQLTVDALTGILNRRGAEAALVLEEARRNRSGVPFSVALFDVDHFKRVNDVHGHATGDEVLRLVAATLASQARTTDHVARWGGEEFLAILPGSIDGAAAFAERARSAVAAMPCPKVDRVTISVGIAELGRSETPSDAIARADERLYAAKSGGRNRVER